MNDFFGKRVICLTQDHNILRGVVQNSSFVDVSHCILIVQAPKQDEVLIGTTIKIDDKDVVLEVVFDFAMDLIEKNCWMGDIQVFLNLPKNEHESIAFDLSKSMLDVDTLERVMTKDYRIALTHPPQRSFMFLKSSIIESVQPYHAILNPLVVDGVVDPSKDDIKKVALSHLFLSLYLIWSLDPKKDLPSWGATWSQSLNVFSGKENTYKGRLQGICNALPFKLKANDDPHKRLSELLSAARKVFGITTKSSGPSSSSSSSSSNLFPSVKSLAECKEQIKQILKYRVPGKYRKLFDIPWSDAIVIAYQKTFNLKPTYEAPFQIKALHQLNVYKKWSDAEMSLMLKESERFIRCFVPPQQQPQVVNYTFRALTQYDLSKFLIFCVWATTHMSEQKKSLTSSSSLGSSSHPSAIPNNLMVLKHVDRQNQIFRRLYHNNSAVATLEQQHDTLRAFSAQQKKLDTYLAIDNLGHALGPILGRLIHEVIPVDLVDTMILTWMEAHPEQFLSFRTWKEHRPIYAGHSHDDLIVGFYESNLDMKTCYVLGFKHGALMKESIKIISFHNLENLGAFFETYLPDNDHTIYMFIPIDTLRSGDATAYNSLDNRLLAYGTSAPVLTDIDIMGPAKRPHGYVTEPNLFDLRLLVISDKEVRIDKKTSRPFIHGSMSGLLRRMWSIEYEASQKQIIFYVTHQDFSFWLLRCRGRSLKNIEPFLGFYLVMAPTMVPYPMLSLMSYDAWKDLGSIKYAEIVDYPAPSYFWVLANRFVPATPYFEDKDAHFALSKHLFTEFTGKIFTPAECVAYVNDMMGISIASPQHTQCLLYLTGETQNVGPEDITLMKELLAPVLSHQVNLTSIASEKMIFYKLYKTNPSQIPSFIGYPYIFVHALIKYADRVFSWQKPVIAPPEDDGVRFGPHLVRVSEIAETFRKIERMDDPPTPDSIYAYPELFKENLNVDIENTPYIPRTHPYVFNPHDIHLLLWDKGGHPLSAPYLSEYFGPQGLPSISQFTTRVLQYVTIPLINFTQYDENDRYITADLEYISKRNAIQRNPNVEEETQTLPGYVPSTRIEGDLFFDKETLEWKLLSRAFSPHIGTLTAHVQSVKMTFTKEYPWQRDVLYRVSNHVWFQFVQSSTEAFVGTGEVYYVVMGYEIDATTYGNDIKYVSYTQIPDEANAHFEAIPRSLVTDHQGLRYWELKTITSDGLSTSSTPLVVLEPESFFRFQQPVMKDIYALPFVSK